MNTGSLVSSSDGTSSTSPISVLDGSSASRTGCGRCDSVTEFKVGGLGDPELSGRVARSYTEAEGEMSLFMLVASRLSILFLLDDPARLPLSSESSVEVLWYCRGSDDWNSVGRFLDLRRVRNGSSIGKTVSHSTAGGSDGHCGMA